MVSCLSVSVFIAFLAVFGPMMYRFSDQREYNRRTTAEDAIGNVDLRNQIIIVTGSNTGIGKPTAKVLLSHGATVIMACRNHEKAINAKIDIINTIISTKSNCIICDQKQLENNLDVITLDLSSLDSIESFVKTFLEKYNTLNYLILNAGTTGLFREWSETSDGIETVFAVNHIGHFYLTMKLTPILIKSSLTKSKGDRQISRVISVASAAHHWAPNPITKWLKSDKYIQDKSEYGYVNYGFSKGCNILFAKDYNGRYKSKGVYSVSLHPGVIATELGRERPIIFQYFWKYIVSNLFLKTSSQGASTTVRTIALDDKEFIKFGGSYFSDCNPSNNSLRSDLFPTDVIDKNKPQQLLLELTHRILTERGKTIVV